MPTLRFHDHIGEIAPADWDALAGTQPFLRHRFLAALESTGCVGGQSGWRPCHATLAQDGRLLAAAPLYLKDHSWGEYVFDWAWADASQRAGLPYYPKLLCAVPFTPVPGGRLLAVDDAARGQLLAGIISMAADSGLSGFHGLFPQAAEAAAWRDHPGILQRLGVQFHWLNRGYADYAAFLAGLNHDKRKKLKQERRKVADAGVQIVRKVGEEISEADWQFFARCYAQTYREHRSTPYLNLAFFRQLGAVLGDHCLLVLAYQGEAPIAAALNLFDETRLYGRYWGAQVFVPSLHFELCYHQGIEFAIERGLQAFEGGAQGEHKLARGFEAVETVSFHWLANPALAGAVSRFLTREAQGVVQYLSELDERAPYRVAEGDTKDEDVKKAP
jgi:hypothetical protein